MSYARSPKDLRSMVKASSEDMGQMQENIQKLRALSEDDRNENAKLNSRIDEQCQLIMVLKRKADDSTVKLQTLEKINKELLDFRDQADSMLKTELKKYNILDGRFNQLVENHEEMIHIKDEYKRVNNGLREENARLKDENSRLFSKTLSEKEETIQELDKRCGDLREQCHSFEQKLRQQQIEWRGKEEALRNQITEIQNSNNQQTKEMHKRLQETEERLKASEHKLQMQITNKKKQDGEMNEKSHKLQKERDEYLALVMQRGKLVQKEQETNRCLQKKISDLEKSVQLMADRFEREADAVNSNMRVQRLSESLNKSDSKYSQMVQEFEAFKKHSNDLLVKEKELNERLRHLYC